MNYLNGNTAIASGFTGTLLEEELLEPTILYQMSTGQIPDLRKECLALVDTFNDLEAPYSLLHFVPVLGRIPVLEGEQLRAYSRNRKTRFVLISNEKFEIVLNFWKPGRASDVHGHPGRGCIFKLLAGKVEELRYTPEARPRLFSMHSLRRGQMAQINDRVAYHQVGNPYGSLAVSLHIYLK